jgi:hypothetical protein
MAVVAVTMPGYSPLLEVAGGVGLAVGAEVLGVVVELGEGGEDAARPRDMPLSEVL